VDSVRIAVLAALNIADESFRQKEALGKAGSATRQKANRLAKELAAALGE
jgi:cell division protein ZapA (FtsZ GTPase activity inhibitor)